MDSNRCALMKKNINRVASLATNTPTRPPPTIQILDQKFTVLRLNLSRYAQHKNRYANVSNDSDDEDESHTTVLIGPPQWEHIRQGHTPARKRANNIDWLPPEHGACPRTRPIRAH